MLKNAQNGGKNEADQKHSGLGFDIGIVCRIMDAGSGKGRREPGVGAKRGNGIVGQLSPCGRPKRQFRK